jgi:hypothetical protein
MESSWDIDIPGLAHTVGCTHIVFVGRWINSRVPPEVPKDSHIFDVFNDGLDSWRLRRADHNQRLLKWSRSSKLRDSHLVILVMDIGRFGRYVINGELFLEMGPAWWIFRTAVVMRSDLVMGWYRSPMEGEWRPLWEDHPALAPRDSTQAPPRSKRLRLSDE